MTIIENQIANDGSTINNAEQINNNIFDDPLKYFCDKKNNENPNIKSYILVMKYILNKDNLKKRFGGSNYKYEELVNFLEDTIMKKNDINASQLDDGYKSIINCIAKTVLYFHMEERDNCLKTDKNLLYAEITNIGLKLKYSEKVKTYELYIEAKHKGEEIIKELSPFLNCATQYGNFFQFNNIYIDEIKNVPFLTEEVKYHVSNEIIPNLIKPLYGESPECGLREIIQNACDASKELVDKKVMSNNDVKEVIVEVYLFEENGHKKLRVRDYGVGMTKDVLLNKYFAIGESSKKDSNLNLVGQFGIGALAAFLLGDTIEVKTKHYEGEKIYHFLYTLNSNQNSNISIAIEKDDDFSHGTEVTICLNSVLSDLTEMDFKKKLKLDEWYVLPDVGIKYWVNGKSDNIHTLRGSDYNWIKLETSMDNVKVRYLDKDNNSQIILNGLIVPEMYKFSSKYINTSPFIAIKSYANTIKLNLERSKIESGVTDILRILQDKLIKDGLDTLKKEKKDIVDEQLVIKRSKYSNDYLKNIPLFFYRDGFGVYSSDTIKNIQYDAIVRVFGNKGYFNVKLSDLEDKVLYIFYDYTLNKSDIADLIDGYGSTYIPNEIIKHHFYYATSQYNGFRAATMQRIYTALGQQQLKCVSVNEFWQQHNKIKEDTFKDFFDEPNYILIGNDYSSIANNVKRLCCSSIINILPKGYISRDIVDDNIDVGLLV